VCYDRVFLAASQEMGVIPDSFCGSKQEIKAKLLENIGGEQLWQRLQGRVYGPCMRKAQMFPGVPNFLLRCKLRDDELFIGHFDETRTPLRGAALIWMEENGFFEASGFNLSRGHVFFSATRKEKVEQISALGLDVFIDDLEDVFQEKQFPRIKRVLFERENVSSFSGAKARTWSEIGNEVLGDMTDEECRLLVQTVLPEEVKKVSSLSGQGNSRIYHVDTASKRELALKCYPDQLCDPRPRLLTEVNACKFLKETGSVPHVVAYDLSLNFALFQWIDGSSPSKTSSREISEALVFVEKLKRVFGYSTPKFGEAVEACLSGGALMGQIETRIDALLLVDDPTLNSLLEHKIMPLAKKAFHRAHATWPSSGIDADLPLERQTLSPSDFGFHNCLQNRDGSLIFIDLEYFGRDDPVKLIADFLWHPAMELDIERRKQWTEGALTIFSTDAEIGQRLVAAWPLYGIRWALIMLNEFRDDGWQKRLYAKRELKGRYVERKSKQIRKAKGVCSFLEDNQLEIPYV
jgi:hypothetical protein